MCATPPCLPVCAARDASEGLEYVESLSKGGFINPSITKAAVLALLHSRMFKEAVAFLQSRDFENEMNVFILKDARELLLRKGADRDTTMELLHLHIDAGYSFSMSACRDFAAILGRSVRVLLAPQHV
jgi:hypothetical protein